MNVNGNGKRGRPTGFKLSESSKKQISESKMGQQHKQETKDKISHALLIYFKCKNPLSEEIINKYCRIDDDELCSWVTEVQDDLDKLEDIRTERTMYNSRKTELAFGTNIEYFSHNITPESIILFKEYCDEHDLNFDDFVDIL